MSSGTSDLVWWPHRYKRVVCAIVVIGVPHTYVCIVIFSYIFLFMIFIYIHVISVVPSAVLTRGPWEGVKSRRWTPESVLRGKPHARPTGVRSVCARPGPNVFFFFCNSLTIFLSHGLFAHTHTCSKEMHRWKTIVYFYYSNHRLSSKNLVLTSRNSTYV